jgi:hypothetical protein
MRVDEARDVLPFLAAPPHQNTAATEGSYIEGPETGFCSGKQHAISWAADWPGTVVYIPAGNGRATGRMGEQIETTKGRDRKARLTTAGRPQAGCTEFPSEVWDINHLGNGKRARRNEGRMRPAES